MMISIVVPVYNEEKAIEDFLERLPYQDGVEVIIADGYSLDNTVSLAQGRSVKITQSVKGRASQMNAGAKMAQGDVLIFLHADCFLEEGALAAVEDCLRNGFIGGCFSLRINSDTIIYRFIEASGNIRAKILKIFYGDQAIFVRRDVFQKLGGYDEVPVFEDIFFSQKIVLHPICQA
jgi:rSAM/selenodomain-associated transferase 2